MITIINSSTFYKLIMYETKFNISEYNKKKTYQQMLPCHPKVKISTRKLFGIMLFIM